MKLLPIGRIQKLYGKNGELILQLYSTAPAKSFRQFYLLVDDLPIPFYFRLLNTRGSAKWIISIQDFEQNAWVEEWIGQEILYLEAECQVETATEAEDGFETLIGFAVYDKLKGELGKIVEFLDYPNNPIYRIDFNGTDILIPIHPDMIIQVDNVKKCIQTQLPEGLVETYL